MSCDLRVNSNESLFLLQKSVKGAEWETALEFSVAGDCHKAFTKFSGKLAYKERKDIRLRTVISGTLLHSIEHFVPELDSLGPEAEQRLLDCPTVDEAKSIGTLTGKSEPSRESVIKSNFGVTGEGNVPANEYETSPTK